MLTSFDGGQAFESIDAPNAHVDHHALWINPDNPEHLINGNDGGVNISYDGGQNWIKNNQPAVGQFYTVYADQQTPTTSMVDCKTMESGKPHTPVVKA